MSTTSEQDKANPPPVSGMIVDNFAGGGGASSGIEMALGRSPDVAINHNPEALCMREANHPETIHLCESVWDVDIPKTIAGRHVQLAWFSPDCFPAGTMILTRAGYRPIEEIAVGDEVLTHKLRWKKVTETSSTVRPLLCIRGHGHPGLLVSPEHPFFARKRKDVWWPEPRGYKRTLDYPAWTPASMLDVGWYWASPTKFPDDLPPPVPVYKGRETTITPALMWLVGRYLADGWTRLTDTRAELVITCGIHEIDGLRQRIDVWPRNGSRAGSDEMAWHERQTGTAYQFTVNHRGFVEWLREHFGHGASEKLIPAWALGMPEEFRRSLLDGYLSGDGWQAPLNGMPCAECMTVSKALAFGIKALAQSLGKTVAVYINENTQVIEGRKVNALPCWKLRWRENVSEQHKQTFREEGLEWTPIRQQEDTAVDSVVYNIGVEDDESYVADGIVVHNCKHFSKAKGGKPVEKNIRGLAWIVLKWAGIAKPDVIVLENVEEFQTWGPLVDNQPCPRRKGMTFKRWVTQLRNLGYIVEWRELRACDYGAPTIRKRLFVIARRDGRKIVWPEPTHGPKGNLFLQPYRTAAECIDWSIPCPSIFGRKRPLAEATLRRIALGIKRYVIDAKEPFIVNLTHGGRLEPISEPLRTTTTANRGEKALITPFLAGVGGRAGQSPERPLSKPYQTITAKADCAMIVPTLVQTGYGEREGQAPRVPGIDKPLGTAVGTGKHALVSAFLAKHYGGVVGSDARDAIGTVTAVDHHSLVTSHLVHLKGTCKDGVPVDRPMPTIQAEGTHIGEVRAFLIKYFGTDQDPRLEEPLHTVTAKDRFGLVTIHGEPYQIVDIGMRMLTPRELFRAQGFPEDYIIDPVFEGKPLTKTAQVRMCGNSVCPPVAAAIIRAQFSAKAMEKAA